MKRAARSTMTTKKSDEMISKFSNNEKLSERAMQFVRGGDGDGGGVIILFPPKPPQGN